MPDNTEKSATEAVDPKSTSLHVKVYSPFKVYYDDLADSITAENDTGVFDVLNGHHNFLTLLNPCDLVIRLSGRDDESISILRGLMHVRKNKVDVFLDV
jgi:F0F1-type ATP synthase epsilon subunit